MRGETIKMEKNKVRNVMLLKAVYKNVTSFYHQWLISVINSYIFLVYQPRYHMIFKSLIHFLKWSLVCSREVLILWQNEKKFEYEQK